MADAHDQTPDLDDEAPDDTVNDAVVDAAIVYDSQTSRLRTYATLIRSILPRIGSTGGFEGQEIAIDSDVTTARNLAIEAIFADIRRIAGEGLKSHGEGE